MRGKGVLIFSVLIAAQIGIVVVNGMRMPTMRNRKGLGLRSVWGEEKGERVNVVEKDEEKSKRIQLRAVFSRKGKHVEDVEYEEDTPVLVPKGFDLTRARGKDEALQIPYHYSVS